MRGRRIDDWLVLLMVLGIVSQGGLRAVAAQPQLQRPRFRAGLDVGYSTASGSWASEGYLSQTMDYRSELQWEELDSILTVVNLDVAVVPGWLRLRAAYGAADVRSGRNTDTDFIYLFDGDEFLEESMYAQSTSETDGDTEVLTADLLLSCSGASPLMEGRLLLDAVFGYFRCEDSLTDSSGLQTVSGGSPVSSPFGGDGANAVYTFEWSALRAGLNAQYALTDRIMAELGALILFNVTHDGPGHWLLRRDLRSYSPNIMNRADGGWGTDFSAWLSYALTSHISARAGVQFWRVSAEDGDHTLYYADGSQGETDLAEVSSSRQSVLVGVCGRF